MAIVIYGLLALVTFVVQPLLLYAAARIVRIAGLTWRRVCVLQLLLYVLSAAGVLINVYSSGWPVAVDVAVCLVGLLVVIVLVRKCLRTTFWRAAGCYGLQAAVCVGIALGIRAVAVEAFAVPTGGMTPTVMSGDRIMVDKITLRFRPPRRGEVLVFRSPAAASQRPEPEADRPADRPVYIQRVVATGGDKVDLREDGLYVNGERAGGPVASWTRQARADTMPNYPIVVPAGTLFMVGDNASSSWDSRFWGPVDAGAVIGLAGVIYASREVRYTEPTPMQPPGAVPGRIRWERIGTIVR